MPVVRSWQSPGLPASRGGYQVFVGGYILRDLEVRFRQGWALPDSVRDRYFGACNKPGVLALASLEQNVST